MVFIRVKKSKGKEYASLVQSTYNRVTQEKEETVINNCGRLFSFEKQEILSFSDFITREKDSGVGSYLVHTAYETIIPDILRYMLFLYGFSPKSKIITVPDKRQRRLLASLSSSVYFHQVEEKHPFCIAVDVDHYRIFETRFDRSCTLKVDPGYLNEYTLQQLFESRLSINPSYDAESQIKRAFIQKVLRAGLMVEQNVLLLVYQKFVEYLKRTQKTIKYEMPSFSEKTIDESSDYHSKKDFMDDFL